MRIEVHAHFYLERFFDLDVRLEQMAASGVNEQVISLGPPMVYWAEPELGVELCPGIRSATSDATKLLAFVSHSCTYLSPRKFIPH